MKKLFKKGMASVLATAIAMSAMIINVAAAPLAIAFKSGSTKDILVKATTTIEATPSKEDAVITAETSDKTVATVTVTGKEIAVTGVAEGTATITVKETVTDKDGNKTTDSKTQEITVTATTLKLFTDAAKGDSNLASKDKGVVAFVNGYKQKTPAVDYKVGTLYPEAAATGKYVVALSTKSDAAPAVTKGKPAADSAAAEIAKASVKNGNIIVTANKKAGDVYVYVYDIKDGKVVSKSGAAKVTVKTAANIVGVYNTSDISGSKPVKDAKAIKTGVVPSGGSATFAAYGDVKDKTVAITDNKFVVSVPEKSKSLIKLIDNDREVDSIEIDNGATFKVKAASLKADTKNSLKVKTANATVEIMNKQSGKKTSLKVVIVNSLEDVNKTNTKIQTGYAYIIDEKGDVSKFDAVFDLNDSEVGTTDKVTVAVLGKQAAFDTTKGKQTEKASKLYAAKLQQTDKGTFRARITAKANAKSDATETAYLYIIATDAAKNVTYYEVATINAKTGEVKALTTPVVYVNGKKQGAEEA